MGVCAGVYCGLFAALGVAAADSLIKSINDTATIMQHGYCDLQTLAES